MSFFEQIASWAMRHGNSLTFGLIWITITAAAAAYLSPALGHIAAQTRQKKTRGPFNLILSWRQAGTPVAAAAALTLLTVFLASYIAMTLAWEDFAYYDHSIFTLFTLKGHSLPLEMLPETGRFDPLGLQEFNLIRPFTNTIAGYHVLPIAQLLIFCWILLILDDQINITARVILVLLVLITPSILVSFHGLVYNERNVLFFLVCLVLCVKRFEQTHSMAWAVVAVILAQMVLYSKETAFVLLLCFAASRLILRYGNAYLEGQGGDQLLITENRLDLCFVSLSVMFLMLYFGFIGIPGKMNYAASARVPRADLVLGYIRVDLLAWLLVAVALGRIYLILRHRAAPLLLWDGLAFGGVAYFFAYLYLGIFSIYYLAPVDLIAVLYVGRLAVLPREKMRSWSKAAAMLLALIVLLQDVLVSAFAVFERKNMLLAKTEIASVVETQYRRGTENKLRLFFPFSDGYVIMEFGAYLNYRGVPVEGAADEGSTLNNVVLAKAGTIEDGFCVEWRRIRCEAVSGPAPGDLVIVLPDDGASLAQASVYRERGELLLFYESYPPVPYWLRLAFDSLPFGPQTGYRYLALPDRWGDASVTKWK
jgi:hypothetical protein